MSNFVDKHPWMTFFLGIFAISGTVAVIQSVSQTRVLAGPPRQPKPLPPKPAAT